MPTEAQKKAVLKYDAKNTKQYDEPQDAYVAIDSDTEFAKQIDGKWQEEVWPVIDELMTIIKTLHPRLYAAVLSKL